MIPITFSNNNIEPYRGNVKKYFQKTMEDYLLRIYRKIMGGMVYLQAVKLAYFGFERENATCKTINW